MKMIGNRRELLRNFAASAALSGISQPVSGKTAPLFPGFQTKKIKTPGAEIHARIGGSGPPLLLLHGFPQTQVSWHRIAPDLAKEFTVVAADLRGYGDSSKPLDGENHANYSKRAMLLDQIDAMRQLGFRRFAVAGHDRGGRVAWRMAVEQPEAVSKVAILDIVPDHYSSVTREFATATGSF